MNARKQTFDAHWTVGQVRWAYKMVVCHLSRRRSAERGASAQRANTGMSGETVFVYYKFC